MSRPVALFVPELRGGGAQRVTLNLAEAFIKRGLKVDLLVGRAEGPLVDDVPDAANLVDFGSRRLALLLPAVIRYLRATKPSALLTTLQGANIIGPLARCIARTDTRVVVREANTLLEPRESPRSARAALLDGLMGIAYRRADQIIANSQATAADLVRFGLADWERLRVIHNPLDVEGIQLQAAEPLDDPWFTPGAPPVILAMGRLVEQKDFGTFLLAMELLTSRRDVRAMILGDGPLRADLETMVVRRGLHGLVALPGFVRNPHRFMSRASVFVLSSRWEGFGNVVVEALAAQTPVVSTDCRGGPREILCDGRFGSLVPVGDFHRMAGEIEAALDSPPDGKALLGRANCFSLDAIAPQYLEALCVTPSVHS
jgi:glycosyltransferase involved in cell wall biosynthesis